ncbi:MAG: hypothetical protein EON59_01660 [Alphaproteobacteria bacterium]|nr:MAG: hypothetical protein EON59_01660 [Alphaproteobacteria bacterium]
MPKFGSHILFAEQAMAKRPDLFPDTHGNALRLGAVGPDMTLFLLDPVTNPIVRKGLRQALSILQTLRTIKKELHSLVAVFDGPVDDLADWITGGLSTDLKSTLNTTIETLIETLKLGAAVGLGSVNVQNPLFNFVGSDGKFMSLAFIAELKNRGPTLLVESADNFGFPFRYFGHPQTDDGAWKQPEPIGDYSKWWWMDMLHYRRTGQFARELLLQATDSVQRSYARGYMSHVAGDICGHPFVNSLVGGPFRNHAYRHIVLESLADTWLWNQQGRGDILDARLDSQVRLSREEIESVSQLILGAMKSVYQDPELPSQLPNRYPDVEDLVGAHDLMTWYLELSTGGSIKRPSPPPGNIPDVVREMQALVSRNQPGKFPKPTGTGLEFIIAVLGWLLKGVVLLAMILTLPLALMARMAAAAPRWLLYFIHLAIYMIHSGIRTLLALMGWGYAGAEDFENFGFLEDWITASSEADGNTYPRETMPLPKPPFYWLIPPNLMANVEQPPTLASPIQGQVTPFWMLDPANKMEPDPAVLDALIRAADPAATVRIEQQLVASGSGGFGNAVDFTIALLDGSLPVPDLDLDGDRGFGYRPWEGPLGAERYL